MKRIFAAIALLALFTPEAEAASSQIALTNSAWTLVGAGSVSVIPSAQTPNVSRIIWQAGASLPSAGSTFGLPINQNGLPTNISAAGNVYARLETTDGQAGTATLNENDGAAFSGTFTWPGSCGNVAINGTPSAGCTAPVVYVGAGSSGSSAAGFVPGATPIGAVSVGITSVTTSIPGGATLLVLTSSVAANNILHCTLGAGPAVLTDLPIFSGQSAAFNSTSATQFSCITSSGTQLVTAVAGSGTLQMPAASDPSLVAAGAAAPVAKAIQGIANGVPVLTSSASAVNVTPTNCSATATGSAQTLIAAAATRHGATIANIDPATGAGEPIWISFTGTAAANTVGSFPLAPPAATTLAGMGSWTSPPGFGFNVAISAIATTGHKISCMVW